MKLAIGLLATAALAQDAATALEQARDKVIAESTKLPRYVCVETIDRSYYSRNATAGGAPSCEKLVLDRKRGRDSLKLEKTDRLRVAVALRGGREMYSWTGAAPYTHGAEDVLNGGPIGTGPFAAYLLQVFTDPSVRFRLLGEPAETVEYGFRVPLEAGLHLVLGDRGWAPSGFSGSLRIDARSLAVSRLEVETDELPAESGMCEESTVVAFGDDLLRTESLAHLVMRDGTVSERAATLSDCREAEIAAPSPPYEGAPVPKDLHLHLELDRQIDTRVAAAGDPISATVAETGIVPGDGHLFGEAHLERKIDAGSKVSGRIVQMTHAGRYFFIGVAFDTLEEKGVRRPFYARLVSGPRAVDKALEGNKLTGHGMANWPHGTFAFRGVTEGQRYVVPAGFQSVWITVDPSDR
jgi:hypothetical protein